MSIEKIQSDMEAVQTQATALKARCHVIESNWAPDLIDEDDIDSIKQLAYNTLSRVNNMQRRLDLLKTALRNIRDS